MNKSFVKHLNIMRTLVVLLLFALSLSVSALFVEKTSAQLPGKTSPYDAMIFDGTYEWEDTLTSQSSSSDYITYSDLRDIYCLDATALSACETAVADKFIRIDTAEELYRFSVDVSYERTYPTLAIQAKDQDKIAFLMSLDYVLGNNIDYSTLGAKMFIPIGYSFLDSTETLHENNFTGTFDGQGYVISNLYVAGYDYLVHEELVDLELVDIALSPYYTMFTTNEGELRNFGLINPTLELLNLHVSITKVSNLVGLNEGIVDHVFVYDNRTDVLEAGIRYRVGSSSGDFQAAGMVHTNTGTFTNSYYVSKVVMNAAYINKFTSQPVLYTNSGTIANLVYDSTVYLLQVVVGTQTFDVATPNAFATGETTATLKSASSVLNQVTNHWFFYPYECYPLAQGLAYDGDNSQYLLSDAIDLAFFARLIGFKTDAIGTFGYAYYHYVLTNSIDMGTISPTAYRTPSVTFYGTLSGYNDEGATLGDNFYIHNLTITTGTLRGSLYYAGLFSVLGSGSIVSDLNINDSSISLTNTDSYYSSIFHIGMLSGRMTGGTIEDVLIDVNIDLGTTAIGETHVGGVVGQASGLIQRVATTGTLDANTHVINSSYSIRPYYYIGGIIGSADAATLSVNNAVNHAAIYGFGTASTFSLASGVSTIDVKIGGVVGYIYNTVSAIHKFVDVANMGDIYLDSIINITSPVVLPSRQRAGGVFGELSGLAPILEISNVYQFANLYNSGTIHAAYQTSTAIISAAGIGVSNTSADVEYALLLNHGNFDYNTTGASAANQLFTFTGTIFDIGSAAVTLSRVYNYAIFEYDNAYYKEISPLYFSLNDNPTLIRFSANYGNISYMNGGGSTLITLTTGLIITGITSSNNVSYLNVDNYGDITVVNVSVATYTLYVAGIAKELSAGKYLKNSLNKGNIVVAYINSSTSGYPNVYIGGVVNLNYAGDLNDDGMSETQPIATKGIINTVNYGEISTSYSATYYGIRSRTNTFAAGVATFNAGSIQDSANLGALRIYNSSTSGTTTLSTNSYTANRVTAYTSGVTVGGIVAATINGSARVYDTANNGAIIALAYRYVRAGGIIATSLYSEAIAGGVTTSEHLLDDSIQSSIISNGLNFGNISAISSVIGPYSTDSYNTAVALRFGTDDPLGGVTGAKYYPNTQVASNDRPAVYAAAGGVVGYGLCVMRRMLNHGTISGTDVAGGIVGATYVAGSLGTTTTTVDINTAINYGNIKAIPSTEYGSIDKVALTYANVSTFFLDDGNSTIFPASMTKEEPRTKRGFGGIFGRLQRGTRGIMSTDEGSFDFIVNANPEIDLIGRLDQDYGFANSARYFQFNDALYYSARYGDTSQAVFTGFYYAQVTITNKSGSRAPYTYQSTVNNLYLQVGSIATYISSPGTSFSFTSSTSYSAGNTPLVFYDPLELDVKWITEDPYDPNLTDSPTQYMYDDAFEMRTNSDLTEYIYYMPSILLADRFQDEFGENYREYGMYVLSTTAGASYGAVLPTNINLDDMRVVNEEDFETGISLYSDYENLSRTYTDPLPQVVIDKYNDMRQTIFNEKSELIPSVAVPLKLEEIGGSGTMLESATVDDLNKRIDLTISMEAYLTGNTSVSYEITQALTSAYALIAISAEDYYGHTPSEAELTAFRALLVSEAEAGISTAYPAMLEITIPSKDIGFDDEDNLLGTFTVYSEAFVCDDRFAHEIYFTEYEIYITFTPGIQYGGGTTGLTDVAFDGGSLIDASSTPTDVTSLGDVGSTGSLRFVFTDTNAVFTAGYDFKDYFVLKYSDDSTVPADYYTVSSVPTVIDSGTGTYEITFTFLGNLRMGEFYFTYRYFPASTLNSVTFLKAPSSAKTIADFSYYSELDSLAINGLAITSDVNLGYALEIDTSTDNFTENINGALPGYVSNATYDISYMTSGSLVISPFAAVTSARLVSVTYSGGYKDYLLEYVIEAEDGTSNTYTHHMYERNIDFVSVMKDGNETDPQDVYAERENELTTFTVDLGLDQGLDLYNITEGAQSYFTIDVSATSLDGLTPYLPEAIVGITYGVGNYLLIYMDYDTIPGIYTFSFTFHRDGTAYYVTLSTSLEISKLEGVNAYLSDIRFSQLANETSYPDIYTCDQSGAYNQTCVINTDYSPVVYFNGIDYDGANLDFYEFFKVDGKVSNIPLASYVPYMLDYLPYGATISRFAYSSTSGWYWTDEVGSDATVEEESLLKTNYTVFPDTGAEPGEEEEVMILYRVTSEDGMHNAYYYVTVTDVEFNATFIFDIYYCTGAGEETCTLAADSVDFGNQMVIVTVKNFLTDGDDSIVGVDDPLEYPTFTELVIDPEIAPSGLISKMTQFIYTYSGAYNYSFGRNRSGFFSFTVELPLDQYLNDLYTYEIKYSDYTLYGVNEYMELNEITLPQVIEGKYFYIGFSTKNRTRRFNVYIRDKDPISTDTPWGLFDFFRSWGE